MAWIALQIECTDECRVLLILSVVISACLVFLLLNSLSQCLHSLLCWWAKVRIKMTKLGNLITGYQNFHSQKQYSVIHCVAFCGESRHTAKPVPLAHCVQKSHEFFTEHKVSHSGRVILKFWDMKLYYWCKRFFF